MNLERVIKTLSGGDPQLYFILVFKGKDETGFEYFDLR
jgi:hypothetical protein